MSSKNPPLVGRTCLATPFLSPPFLATLVLAWGACSAVAESLVVPNGSFESPPTPFVSLLIDSWQRTPKPDWYVEDGGFLWSQLTGIFVNTAPGAVDHIEGLDGRQAAWLFAVPEAGYFQEIRDAGGSQPALYAAGESYRLTLDVLGGGGNMVDGATLEAGFIRWDANTNRIWVASMVLTNGPALADPRTSMRTVSFTMPGLPAGDPAVGWRMGVQVLSTLPLALQGGYWDVDHVRVERLTVAAPVLSTRLEEGGLRIGWASQSGVRYRVRRGASLGSWEDLGTPLAGTGEPLAVVVPLGADGSAFFSVVAETAD